MKNQTTGATLDAWSQMWGPEWGVHSSCTQSLAVLSHGIGSGQAEGRKENSEAREKEMSARKVLWWGFCIQILKPLG